MDQTNATQSDKYIVNNRGSIVKHLQLQSNWLEVSQGDHLRLMASGGELAQNLIASRVGDDLVVLFDDGSSIVFMGYFACPVSTNEEDADSCSVTLAGDDQPYVVPAGAGYASSNAQVIYHQGQFAPNTAKNSELDKQLAQSQDTDTDALLVNDLADVEPAAAGGFLLPSLAGGGLLAGVAGGGGSAVAATTATVITKIAGSVVLGPLIAGHGVSVYAYAKDGTALGFTRVAEDGSYQLVLNQAYTGYVIVKAVDANDADDYRDEASKANKEMTSDLRALVKVTAGQTVTASITPVTELALLELDLDAGDGGRSEHLLSRFSDTELSAINATVARALGLTNVDITNSAPRTTIDVNGNATGNADSYGNILAAISGIESNAGKTTQQVLEQLAAGLTEGSFNPQQKQELVAGARKGAADVNAVGTGLDLSNTTDITNAWQTLEAMHTDPSRHALTTENLSSLGIDTVSQADQLALLNETIKQLPKEQSNSIAELEGIAAAVVRVKAIGAENATAPTASQYGQLGFSAISTDPEAALVTDLLQQQGESDYASISQIAGVVDRLNEYLTNGGPGLAKADVERLGMNSVSESDLPLFNYLLAQKTPAELDSYTDISDCWSTGSIVHRNIATIANASINDDASSLTVQSFTDAGISGVNDHNLSLVKSVFSHADFSAPEVAKNGQLLSVAQQTWVQNHVNVLAKITALVDNPAAGSEYDLTIDGVTRLGYDDVTAQGLSIFQEIISNRDTATELKTATGLLKVIAALEALAILANGAGATSFTAANSLTHEQYTSLGMTAVDNDSKAHFLNLILDVRLFNDVASWRVIQQFDEAVEHWFADASLAGAQDPLTLADLRVLNLDTIVINGETLVAGDNHIAAIRNHFNSYSIITATKLSDLHGALKTLISQVDNAITALQHLARDNNAASNAGVESHLNNIVFFDPLVDLDEAADSSDVAMFRELINTDQLGADRLTDWQDIQALIVAIEYQDLSSGDLSGDVKAVAETMLFADVLSNDSIADMLAADNQAAVRASVTKAMNLVALDDYASLTQGQKLTIQDLTNLGVRSSDADAYSSAIVALANDQWQLVDSVAELNGLVVL